MTSSTIATTYRQSLTELLFSTSHIFDLFRATSVHKLNFDWILTTNAYELILRFDAHLRKWLRIVKTCTVLYKRAQQRSVIELYSSIIDVHILLCALLCFFQASAIPELVHLANTRLQIHADHIVSVIVNVKIAYDKSQR
jgi:hypothetical protein